MYGFPRLQDTIGQHAGGVELIDYLLDHLAGFTGPEWEQEDDVTLLTLQRRSDVAAEQSDNGQKIESTEWVAVSELNIASQPGNERQAMEKVAEIVDGMAIPADRMEKLKTAVAEATMNAMEHGNKYQADVPVQIEVLKTETAVAVRISDQGGGQPVTETELPDLEAKLAGQQSPRGWGLLLIKNMVDEMNIIEDGPVHTVELVVNLEEGA
jgi:anti-sigma regulatory factor (Ser/Thr protein kinase)